MTRVIFIFVSCLASNSYGMMCIEINLKMEVSLKIDCLPSGISGGSHPTRASLHGRLPDVCVYEVGVTDVKWWC